MSEGEFMLLMAQAAVLLRPVLNIAVATAVAALIIAIFVSIVFELIWWR